MKGLLHRMAARAAGTAVAVRADIAAHRAAGDGTPPSDGIGFEPVVSSTPTPTPTPTPHRTGWRSADDPAPDPLPVPMPEPSPASVPTTHSAHRPPAHASPGVAGRSAVAAPKPTLPSPGMAMADADPPPFAGTPAPRRAAFVSPVDAASDGLGHRVTSDADGPARLLPVGPHPAPLAAPPQLAHRAASARGPGAPGDADADTEVHIHIGRIDVTAVPQAPPPRRRAVPAPAPLSLDGYLAQRGRA